MYFFLKPEEELMQLFNSTITPTSLGIDEIYKGDKSQVDIKHHNSCCMCNSDTGRYGYKGKDGLPRPQSYLMSMRDDRLFLGKTFPCIITSRLRPGYSQHNSIQRLENRNVCNSCYNRNRKMVMRFQAMNITPVCVPIPNHKSH